MAPWTENWKDNYATKFEGQEGEAATKFQEEPRKFPVDLTAFASEKIWSIGCSLLLNLYVLNGRISLEQSYFNESGMQKFFDGINCPTHQISAW